MRYDSEARENSGQQASPGTGGEHGLKEKAAEGVQDVAHVAQDAARSRADEARVETARVLETVANSLRESGDRLRGEHQGAGNYVGRAADQVSRLADYVQRTDVDQMVNRVERFARERPELFIGGAFLAGVLAARFLKASKSDAVQSGGSSGYLEREVPTSVSLERDASGQAGTSWGGQL
jgi:hypothetical protein